MTERIPYTATPAAISWHDVETTAGSTNHVESSRSHSVVSTSLKARLEIQFISLLAFLVIPERQTNENE